MRRVVAVIVALAGVAVALPVVGQAKPPKPPKPGKQTDLTIAAQPSPTVFRGASVISGRLKGRDNAGKTVVLREDEFPYGTGIRDAATTTTNAKGDYSFTRRPSRNTAYQAVADTGASYGTAVSIRVLVNVRIRMSLRVSDASPRRGQIVRFRGGACPAHDGLLVRIQRKTRKGTFRTVRRTTLRPATRCSVYRRRFRVYRDGTYRVSSDDRDHARGFSGPRFLNVHW